MRHSLIAASLALAFTGVQAVTLDFGNGPGAPTICAANDQGTGAMVGCANSSRINQDYGDIAGVVDVTYFSQPQLHSDVSLRWWAANYNDLYGVLWADGGDNPSSHGRIELKALGGNTLHLTQFDLGAFPNRTLGTIADVYEIGSNVSLFNFTGSVGSGGTAHNTFATNLSSSVGFWIEWKDSAFNVGIDNIIFNADVQAIPEPSTYALLLGGLAAVGLLARRRRG